jgi:vacuolar-type H+-ATPase subunit H
MEKVWEELKKIEAKAEGILAEAQKSANTITNLARQQAETLIANSKGYAEEEAQKLYKGVVQEANRNRDEQLKANQDSTEELRARAEKYLDKASLAVETAVLGENKR